MGPDFFFQDFYLNHIFCPISNMHLLPYWVIVAGSGLESEYALLGGGGRDIFLPTTGALQ